MQAQLERILELVVLFNSKYTITAEDKESVVIITLGIHTFANESRFSKFNYYDFAFQILPEDAHLRVNGKLHISLTRVYDRQNVIISHFNTREELIQVRYCPVIISLPLLSL